MKSTRAGLRQRGGGVQARGGQGREGRCGRQTAGRGKDWAGGIRAREKGHRGEGARRQGGEEREAQLGRVGVNKHQGSEVILARNGGEIETLERTRVMEVIEDRGRGGEPRQ